MATSDGGKQTVYAVVNDSDGRKRFKCLKCHRLLCSNHSVLYHLYSAHNLSPLKRVTKRYLDDPSIEIPRSNLKRQLEINNSTKMSSSEERKDFVPMATESILNEYNGNTLEGHPENREIENGENYSGADAQCENICYDLLDDKEDLSEGIGDEDDGGNDDDDDSDHNYTVDHDFSDDKDCVDHDSSDSSLSDFSSDQEDYDNCNLAGAVTIFSEDEYTYCSFNTMYKLCIKCEKRHKNSVEWETILFCKLF